ncbi:aminopeptidase P family protein [Sphingobacterium bovistauri]|uniref:Xaa-Pro aminopeptidase n=1 Tax=Sphingobacterium bovistauri TaxID=2781959 RepID=A0ABS7Z0W8_9SPHI|nr:aminopeptidase P family protein [Sphingobacterium bovistauri]MCA5003814.1 aminopeptidase P N-terminal domain-containing protein [Sphingobacterium bovistauri]
MFSTDTYTNRRQQLSHNINSNGILLFLTNKENPINFEHNTYPFRQDSTFLYYFGINAAGISAVIDLDSNETIIFGDEASIDDIIWTGKIETLKEKANKSGVYKTLPYKELKPYFQKVIQQNRTIHYLPPYQAYNHILIADLTQQHIYALQPSASFIQAVVQQRSVKEHQEVQEIEKALTTTVEIHKMAMTITKPGIREYEIINQMRHFAENQGCKFAYPPIVTKHGEILHNLHSHHRISLGDMILNDSGCETELGYAADLTRTFPVSEKFTPIQRDIYNIVHQAINTASGVLSPQIKFRDVHLRAVTTLMEGLKDIGIVKANIEDAVQADAFTLFFQCGTGHMMGLDVHDMEDLGEQYVGYTSIEPKDTQTFGWKSLRLAKKLEVGNVLTVEPGIYFIPTLIDLWAAERKLSEFINYDKLLDYKNFGGIRIEDNYVITADGYRTLGPELIKSIDEIEELRSSQIL